MWYVEYQRNGLVGKANRVTVLGVIGGSGLYELDILETVAERTVETPYGVPSDAIVETRHGDHRLLFLPRHGRGHRLAPSEVPYAANILALKQLGCTHVLSMSAVGGLIEELGPGKVCLPDQFIDRTAGRRSSFFGDGVVGHVSLADPTCNDLRGLAAAAARSVDPSVRDGGTYICIDGPQFSTRAESNLYRAWGCHIVGMTNATEAKLAREAGLCYASVCFVTDYDCWKTDEEPVTVEQVLAVLQANATKAKDIVAAIVGRLDELGPCAHAQAAQHAVVTAPDAISPKTRERLHTVLATGT